MDYMDYEQGLWSYSWDDIRGFDGVRESGGRDSSVVQGAVRFGESGVALDIPFGRLLVHSNISTVGNQSFGCTGQQCLYGRSWDNKWFVLRNPSCISENYVFPSFEGRQTITGEDLLVGDDGEFDSNRNVVEMRLYIRNLEEWYGYAAFDYKVESDGVHTVSFNPAQMRHSVLFDGQDLKITLNGKYNLLNQSIARVKLNYACWIEVEFKDETTIERAYATAVDLSWFFAFCAGRLMPIREMSFRFKGDKRFIRYLRSTTDFVMPRCRLAPLMPFPYCEIKDDIGVYLERWLNPCQINGDKRKTPLFTNARDEIISLLSYNWQLPESLRIVAAVQALEALSRFEDETFVCPKKGKQGRDQASKKCNQGKSEDSQRRGKERKANQMNAEQRDRKLLKGHECIQTWLVPAYEKFAKDAVSKRNDNAHVSCESSVDPIGLGQLADGVVFVCYAIIWDLLGMNSKRLKERVRDSRYKFSIVQWLQHEYASEKKANSEANHQLTERSSLS